MKILIISHAPIWVIFQNSVTYMLSTIKIYMIQYKYIHEACLQSPTLADESPKLNKTYMRIQACGPHAYEYVYMYIRKIAHVRVTTIKIFSISYTDH